MIEAILLSIAGLVGLAIGGEFLVKGSVGIAQRLGVSNLVTGLVIVGFATSMPEMVASVQAVSLGSPEIAWGNIAGSNIANSMLILGATALIAPIVLTGTGRRDAVVALIVSAIILAIGVTQIASVWIGVALLVMLVTYIVWRYRHPRTEHEEDDGDPPSWASAIVFFLIGLGLLVGGGKLLVDGAIDLARLAGISETVIGLTIVAIGTSLPELAASVAAALRGKPGLALGNVVGSNIYNLLLIGGVTMILAPLPAPASLNDLEWPLVVGTALIILLLFWFASRISRMLGAALLAGFVAFNVFLFL
ncbi:MAG: calcium/sodium antiporter [Erythrobacter sp.]